MNLKTSSALLLMILLTSCATASPTPEIIPPTPLSTLTPTATPIPSETPIPKPTNTLPPSETPTPTIELIGLAPTLEDLPLLSYDEAFEHFQKAISDRSLVPKNPEGKVQVSYEQRTYTGENTNGSGVRLACWINRGGCKLVDSFQIPTENGTSLRMYLVEIVVTLEDGSQGPVIYPIILDQPTYFQGGSIDQQTRGEFEFLFQQTQGRGLFDFHFTTNRDSSSKTPVNPALQEILNKVFQPDSRAQELLNKMYELAGQQKSLSQSELTELFGLLLEF